MIQLPNFTQYYLVSMIIPGIFNLFMVAFSIKLSNLKNILAPLGTISWWEYSLFIIMAIIFTLCFGMLVEKLLFKFLILFKKDENKANGSDYDNFNAWRTKIYNNVEKDEIKGTLLTNYVEKLVSEYYCLNNIIIGTLVSIIITIYAFCKNPQLITGLILVILIVMILCILRAMYIFQKEYTILFKTLLTK